MTTIEDFRGIYRYNWHVLQDYCDALSNLPAEELLKNREASYHSMKNIFFHILGVHDGWLNVTAQGESANPPFYEKDFDDVRTMSELRDYMEKIVAKEEQFLETLTDKDLDRPVKAAWKDRPYPLRDALLQVTFEQAHHVGELIALYWQQDIEPPEMTWVDIHHMIDGPTG